MHLLRHEAQSEHHIMILQTKEKGKGFLSVCLSDSSTFSAPYSCGARCCGLGRLMDSAITAGLLSGSEIRPGWYHTLHQPCPGAQTRGSCSEQAVISYMPHHHADCGGLYKVCGALRTLATLVPVTVSVRAAIDPSFFTITDKAPITYIVGPSPGLKRLLQDFHI